VATALDHVQRCARGVENPHFISTVREGMRKRRDVAAKHLDAATDWDVALRS
jgi:hypothetical protein